MEYVFGTKGDKEVLKTKGQTHSNLSGYHQLERKYPDQTVTDSFRIVQLLESKEDTEGNCYDWYEIDHHYRDTDKFTAKSEALQEQIDAITPYTDTKTAYIGDTEVVFSDVPEGNLSIFFDKPYSKERADGKLILTFEPLEEVASISISIL